MSKQPQDSEWDPLEELMREPAHRADTRSENDGPCPVHGAPETCLEAFAAPEGDCVGCVWFAPVSSYKPRALKSPTEKAVRSVLSKRKRAKEAGEQWYESPEEWLIVRASWLKRVRDPLKLSGVAFSLATSIVNHHINQYRRQAGVVIRRDLLEDLVIAELRVLDVYGYAEWVPGAGPKKRAIAWDEVVESAVRSNLPDLQTMSAKQAVLLLAEIDQQIEEGAAEANRQREKGLEPRRTKKERRIARYRQYLEEHPNATVQMAATDLDLSRSTIESYRRELGLVQQRDNS